MGGAMQCRQLTLLTSERCDKGLGEVFTRRWVVDFILDLAGYTPDRDLTSCVAVEPACGAGAFLGPMVERLVQSAHRHGRDLRSTERAIRAFDVSESNVEQARKTVVADLILADLPVDAASDLAELWVRHQDFLLLDEDGPVADFVLGNPPYVRLEDVPPSRTAAYRTICPTMQGRSDVYVGFIEKGLGILQEEGVLAFIVADRWMHNQYGAALRSLVAKEYSVEAVVEMHDVDAFEEEVSAYPAVTVLRRRVQGNAVVATTTRTFDRADGDRLRRWMAMRSEGKIERPAFSATRLPGWFPGDELWPSGDPASLALVAELERRFPPLEDADTGTRVGIGVASGADSTYLTRDSALVEEDRLLPLAIAADTVMGRVSWSGSYLVNPWIDGHLVDLSDYPRLAAHFQRTESVLRARHVARRRPQSWYRTIDKVDPSLRARTKLLIPDLKASIHPVLDDGELYPHHNLYYVVSDGWDMEALGGLLLSDIANLFVGTYCVKMRGGCYRFQAQYLRRIRVPAYTSVPARVRRALRQAYESLDREAATSVAMRLYGVKELPAAARTTRR